EGRKRAGEMNRVRTDTERCEHHVVAVAHRYVSLTLCAPCGDKALAGGGVYLVELLEVVLGKGELEEVRLNTICGQVLNTHSVDVGLQPGRGVHDGFIAG